MARFVCRLQLVFAPGLGYILKKRLSPGRVGSRQQGEEMKKYVCNACGYVYDPQRGDPDHGIKPGTPFEQLPAGWICPECGVGKDEFSPQ